MLLSRRYVNIGPLIPEEERFVRQLLLGASPMIGSRCALLDRRRDAKCLRVLLDPNPWGVKKEGVPCGKIVSTPRT